MPQLTQEQEARLATLTLEWKALNTYADNTEGIAYHQALAALDAWLAEYGEEITTLETTEQLARQPREQPENKP